MSTLVLKEFVDYALANSDFSKLTIITYLWYGFQYETPYEMPVTESMVQLDILLHLFNEKQDINNFNFYASTQEFIEQFEWDLYELEEFQILIKIQHPPL